MWKSFHETRTTRHHIYFLSRIVDNLESCCFREMYVILSCSFRRHTGWTKRKTICELNCFREITNLCFQHLEASERSAKLFYPSHGHRLTCVSQVSWGSSSSGKIQIAKWRRGCTHLPHCQQGNIDVTLTSSKEDSRACVGRLSSCRNPALMRLIVHEHGARISNSLDTRAIRFPKRDLSRLGFVHMKMVHFPCPCTSWQ